MFPRSLTTKLIALLCLLLAVVGLGWYAHHRIYVSGYAEGSAKVQKAWDDANAQASKRKVAIEIKQIPLIQNSAQPVIDGSQVRVQTVTKTVEKIVYANPSFAACARPADLQRLRDDALQRIADAAGGYAPAPSSSAPQSTGTGQALLAGDGRH